MSEQDPARQPLPEHRVPWPVGDKAAVQALCSECATELADGLQADRTAIVYVAEQGHLAVGGQCGFPRFSVYTNAPVSLSVLEDAALKGRTTLSHDARSDHETLQTLTLQLSEAVSLLCVPILNSVGQPAGAIYADTNVRMGAFRHQQLRFARDFAEWLGARLAGAADCGPAPKPIQRNVVKEPSAATVPEPTGTAEPGGEGLSGKLKDLVGRVERFIFYA